ESFRPGFYFLQSEIIRHGGYPSEEYEVLTRDGYYLTLNRIPHGRKNPGKVGAKPAVLLQHGVLAEGSNWVENLANNSLGFILADAGYDVWVGNNRGTSWSRKHQNLSNEQVKFWNFSFHEMAMYDLPAMIDFVLQKTGQQQIYYVGHSQGCTIALIAFSSMPELARKVKMFFALAPAVTFKYARSILMKIGLSLRRLPNVIQFLLGKTDATLQIKKLWKYLPSLCRYPMMYNACTSIFSLLGGCHEKNLNVTRLDVYTSHYPDGTSVKTMLHWAQVLKSGEFKAFDYGRKNPAVYHQETPPLYQVEKMPVATAVWSGGADFVADWRDIRLVLPRIPNLVSYRHIPLYNHWDFIWGLDAPENLYNGILELMN
ncbi:LICH hydrolase, partial [Piaya cayana]|nr:LICH hydrolase [Piaya cayana]